MLNTLSITKVWNAKHIHITEVSLALVPMLLIQGLIQTGLWFSRVLNQILVKTATVVIELDNSFVDVLLKLPHLVEF